MQMLPNPGDTFTRQAATPDSIYNAVGEPAISRHTIDLDDRYLSQQILLKFDKGARVACPAGAILRNKIRSDSLVSR